MRYLKENNNTSSLFSYADFLKQRTKVQIDGEDASQPINTMNGIVEMHPNAEHLEIGSTEISDFSSLSNLKHLKVLMLYNNPKMSNLNGLKGLNLESLSISKCGIIKNGDCDINVKRLNFYSCSDYTLDLSGIKGLERLDLREIKKIKDLSFLKDFPNLERLDLSDLEIDSMYGIQYNQDLDIHFFNKVGDHDFMYHKMFYEKMKGKIKDYWADILNYWYDQCATEDKNGFDVLLETGDLKEVLVDGIKLPEKEYSRLFTPQQLQAVKSFTAIKKFNL